MNSEIYKKATSLTLMTIMVAGGLTFAIPGVMPAQAEAISSNPHLFVSAEGQNSDNEISPHNIIEVVIDDPNIRETDDATGRPTVTINGADLSMVQGTDGAWYAYFADRASLQGGVQDIGYGTYEPATKATESMINGDTSKPAVDLSGTVGVMLPYDANTGHPLIREAKTPNDYNSNVAYWPFIQLYDIAADSNLKIVYDRAGGDETVTLLFDDPAESHMLDREKYPVDAQVLITIDDYTLNIDPTDEDTWVFDTTNGIAYYNIFDEDGQKTSNDNPKANYMDTPEVNIDETLTIKRNAQGGMSLIDCQVTQDFGNAGDEMNWLHVNDDDGLCYDDSIDTDHILAKDNDSLLISFVESGSNESTFVNWAEDNKANLVVRGDAARGNSFEVQYSSPGYISGLVGHFFASFALDTEAVGGVWNSGERLAVTLTDTDANTNPLEEQELEVKNVDTKLIPTIQIGNPFTLRTGNSSLDVTWYSIGSGTSDPTPPTNGTDPTPPTNGTDPTPPTNGTDPTPPTNGTDPTPPTNGTDPTPPTNGTDPTPPTNGTDPTPPTNGTDPTPPTNGTDPTPPTNGTDPTPPTNGTDPTPPTNGTDPTPPTNGTDPTPPTNATDTEAPNAPTITSDSEKTNTGKATIKGTVDEASTIKIYSGVDSSVIGNANSTDGKTWSGLVTFNYDGPQSITATATDDSGNESEPSDPPTQIAVLNTTIAATVITDAEGFMPTTVSGTARPGSNVTLTYSDESFVVVSVNADKTWMTDLSLELGDHTLTAESDANPIVFETTITVYEPTVSITKPTDGQVIATDYISVDGIAEPGATVTLTYTDGVTTHEIEAIANQNREWGVSIEHVHDGYYTLHAASNYTGILSDPINVIVNRLPTEIMAPNDGDTLQTQSVKVSGIAYANSVITLSYGEESVTFSAKNDSSWVTTLTLPIGNHTLTATSDKNPVTSNSITITVGNLVDTTMSIDGDNFNNGTIRTSGSTYTGSTVTITLTDGDTSLVYTKQLFEGKTTWSYTLPKVPSGTYTLTAVSSANLTPTDPITITVGDPNLYADITKTTINNQTVNVYNSTNPNELLHTEQQHTLIVNGSSNLSSDTELSLILDSVQFDDTLYADTKIADSGNWSSTFVLPTLAKDFSLTLFANSNTEDFFSNTYTISVPDENIIDITPTTGTDSYNAPSQIHNIVQQQQSHTTIHKAFATVTDVTPQIHNVDTTTTADDGTMLGESPVELYSDRLIIASAHDTVNLTDTATIKVDLGASADDLMESIHDPAGDFDGTNMFNYDVSGITATNENFVVTDIKLVDATGTYVTLASGSESGLVDLVEHSEIFNLNGDLSLEIHLDTSTDNKAYDTYEFCHDMPIVADFFSFGLVGLEGDRINNAVYRLQLEEAGKSSSDFVGDVEYIMLNQLNILEPATYAGLRTISDQIQIVVHEDFTDEDSVRINYLDLGADGVATQIAIQQEAPTHSGVVTLDSEGYKVADTVTITLEDADLNVDTDVVDIYTIVNNDALNTHNTVGSSDDTIGMLTLADGNPFARLLDVTFNDELWTSCGDDSGFSGTGLTMIETAKDSGVFTGDFQIPNVYCAGGETPMTVTGVDIEVNYLDFRDASGESIEVGASAAVRAHTGSVSLDRTVYPVPFGANTFEMANGESLDARDLSVHIRVNDPDFDLSAMGEDTMSADTLSVRVIRAAESFNVTIADSIIYEVAPDAGIFELDLSIDSTMGPDGQIRQGDILQVEYKDPTDASGDVNTVTDSATFDLRNGVLQSDKPAYIIGSDMILTLIEPDFDLDNDAAETYPLNLIEWDSDAATVPMGSDLAFDPEPSDLRETGDSTGIFQVIVEVPAELEGDRLERGEEIELEYVDWGPSGADTVGDEDEDVNLTVYTSNFGATVELDQKVYTWTDKVYMTIVAPDHNFDSDAVDEIGDTSLDPIKISTRGHDIDEYTLVETGTSTGIFTGEIILTGFKHDADGNAATGDDNGYDTNPRTSGTGPTDGFIEADDDDGITVSFEFSEDETVVSSSLIRWNVGEVQWLEASYPASGTGIVRIIDSDMNWDPEVVNNFDVDVWSNSDAGGIDLTVTETNEATGIFEGTVVFTTTDPSSGHRLRVAEGDLITAEYEDNTLPDPYTTADELDVSATSLIGTIVPPLERAPASNLRVVDAFGNSLDTVSVDQQVQITADLANGQDRGQPFAYLVQIQDGNGVTVSLAWITGTLESGQTFNPALSWIPTEAGLYEATAFVWESVDNPTALSPSISTTITVS